MQRAKRAKAKRLAQETLARRRAEEKQRREDAEAARRAAARRAATGNPTKAAAPGAPAVGFSDAESSSKSATPFVAVAFLLALVVLTLGLLPAYSVPWYRLSIVLEEHQLQLAFVGGMTVLATGILFLAIVLGG